MSYCRCANTKGPIRTATQTNISWGYRYCLPFIGKTVDNKEEQNEMLILDHIPVITSWVTAKFAKYQITHAMRHENITLISY